MLKRKKVNVNDEIQKYKKVKINKFGETAVYETTIIQKIVRPIEMTYIDKHINKNNGLILDYGCGSGWLTRYLSKKNFVVGIDISENLLRYGKINSSAFLVMGSCEYSPFKDNTFTKLLGISILHHLNLNNSLKEIKRIISSNGLCLFMEPNILNPFSWFGRTFFPLEVHTESERPFLESHINRILLSYFSKIEINNLFMIAFPLSRFFKILDFTPPKFIISFLKNLEELICNLKLIKKINSLLIIVVHNNSTGGCKY
ncbi:MAG: class I SAM-dependent methyltransferase [Candidatus Odinarchaeia archaeon]